MRCSMQRAGGFEQQLHLRCRPLQGSKRQQRLRHRTHDALLPLDTAASLTTLVEHHSAAAAGVPSSQQAVIDLAGRGIAPHQAFDQGLAGPDAAGLGLMGRQQRHQQDQQQEQHQAAAPVSAEQPSLQSAETRHHLAPSQSTFAAATEQQQLAAALPRGQRQQQHTQHPPREEQPWIQRRRQQHETPPAMGVGAQFKRQLPAPPLKYPPTGRGQGLKQASAMAKHIRGGRHVLLPAGSGMQLARGLSALATARTLLLSHSSTTGLAFQPTFATQQQQQQQADTAGSGLVMMLVTGLPESQLRRFDRQPLAASQQGEPSALAAAAFARLCQQGFTSIRAAGPDAARVALMAAAEARRKLLGCGLDLAVVPAEEAGYSERQQQYQGQYQQQQYQYQGQQQYQHQYQGQHPYQYGADLGYGGGSEEPRLVRTTVLHCVRCEPQQPWQLLPWPVAAEQQPAVQWLRQQQAGTQQHQEREEEVQQQGLQPAAVQHAAGQAQTGLLQIVAGCLESPTPELGSSPGGPDATSSSSGVGGGVLEAGLLHVPAPTVARRQPGALLLHKQGKGKRQLVAAAQGPGA